MTTYYHGSGTKLEILEPRLNKYDEESVKSKVPPLLYLANRKDMALAFCGKQWSDAILALGTVDGTMTLTELKPGVLKSTYTGTYYLHIVNKPDLVDELSNYRKDTERTNWEVAVSYSIIPDRIDKITDVLAAMKKEGVVIHHYDRNSDAYKRIVGIFAKRVAADAKYGDHIKERNPELYKDIAKHLQPDTDMVKTTTSKHTRNRKMVEEYILKHVDLIDPSKYNSKRYRDMFDKMSDKQFHEYMLDIKRGEQQIYLYAPNMDNEITLDNLVKLADKFGVDILERIWFRDYNTGVMSLTPEKYMILTLPIRRAKQTLTHKRSLPESDKTIDYLSGQVSRPDKAAGLSQIEAQFLIAKNLPNTTSELVKYRGGDVHAYSELKQALAETGTASLTPTNSIARSAIVLQVLFKTIHLDINVV